MKPLIALLAGAATCLAQDWQVARPGWQYQFPRDHRAHPEFKTEWWYFTGNLFDETGARFGFELTFFREGIIPPTQRTAERSRFIVNDLKFAHFTVTDTRRRQFRFDQKASRGAFDDAGFDRNQTLAWIDGWNLQMGDNGEFDVNASLPGTSIKLRMVPEKPPVVHGLDGVSAKAFGEEHASHYYSITRLTTRGTLRMDGRDLRLSGTTWFDHEWATNQLAPHQVGWNWLCVQFENRTELMLYQMRDDDGTIDPASSGTFVAADGKATHLTGRDFSMTPTATWKSKQTGAIYPVGWTVNVPAQKFRVVPVLDDQELALLPLTYWEGAVDVTGDGSRGVGYLELTGYAGLLKALNR